MDVSQVLAHAFGERYDLPIPLSLFVLGGGLVVLASFAFIAVRPPKASTSPGPDSEDVHLGPPQPVWGVVSLVVLAFLTWIGLTGSQVVQQNLLSIAFWLLVWVVVPLTVALVGDWTQPVNPFAFLTHLVDRAGLRKALLGGEAPLRWPAKLGWWPAALLFFLTYCGELVFNLTVTIPRYTALSLLVYAALSTFAGLLFGRSWLEHGELFTVLFNTWGRLGWFRFGAPGRRGFGGGLDVPFRASISRIVFVLLLLVGVNFDGLLATPAWSRFQNGLPWNWESDSLEVQLFQVGTFLLLGLTTAIVFGRFALAAARAGGHRPPEPANPEERNRRRIGYTDAFAGLLPSLLPIAFGYQLVHYLQYVIVNGQLLIPLIGNPTGLPSWPLDLPYPFNSTYQVQVAILPSAFYWYLGVAIIIAVHVVAVMVAHRHLVALGVSAKQARRSEYPWLVAMVAYTMLSLWLIAQPLTQPDSGSQLGPGALADPTPSGGNHVAAAAD